MNEIALGNARRLTERIRLMALTVGENIDKLKALVSEAKESDAHLALGYVSWPAYLADVLGETPMRLEQDARRELVSEMFEQGISKQGIAKITGASRTTVIKDLREQGVQAVHPAIEPVADEEPESYWSPAESFVGAHPLTGEVIEPVPEPEPAPIATTTGLDGKQYPKPVTPARKPQRRALTETARDVGWEIRKAAEKLQRIQDDDRFTRNKDEVATHLRSHLQFAIETCQGILDALNTQNKDTE